ncbi:hypothetical protein [Nocardioides currus]|uniref:hypothetical protein n=1 Tax=Nocardioides currus TaxID=2133958 RepID=UPI001402D28C|nr:hypothetical protein [Nocardioides currus]
MTSFAFIIVLAALATLLVSYARHDLFAGSATHADDHDELGPVEVRQHLVPRSS